MCRVARTLSEDFDVAECSSSESLSALQRPAVNSSDVPSAVIVSLDHLWCQSIDSGAIV
jgi:hypothetical protein